MKEILIIYKYLVYSDKKIHHIMYKETVDEINENLLADFIDSDDESKIIQPKPLSQKSKSYSQDPKVKIADLSNSKRFMPNDNDDFNHISK